MKKDIRERLKGEVLLADGAMGTLLVSRGAPPDGPRSPNALTAPELVREIHDDYVAAGAQLLSTNTWDANRSKLGKFDWADSVGSAVTMPRTWREPNGTFTRLPISTCDSNSGGTR